MAGRFKSDPLPQPNGVLSPLYAFHIPFSSPGIDSIPGDVLAISSAPQISAAIHSGFSAVPTNRISFDSNWNRIILDIIMFV
jgi:hypothetical protein